MTYARNVPTETPVAAKPYTKRFFLLPGQLYIARVPTKVTTILGPCIATFLFDPLMRIGGINHFLSPGEPDTAGLDDLRWGRPAIERLIAALVQVGARRDRLQAVVVGGAHLSGREVPSLLRIGERNLQCATEELERYAIPVVSKDVGGKYGRKLVAETHTGMALVTRLRSQHA
jgi:chemotaxis protein CheD